MDIQRVRRQKRKNVQEQNAVLKDDIHRCAEKCKSSEEFSWLVSQVIQRQLGSVEGIVCDLRVIPEEGGMDWIGIWLSDAERFFQFSVHCPYDGSSFEVEEWEEVTEVMPNNAHTPGTGKSLAFLALEVLDERRKS